MSRAGTEPQERRRKRRRRHGSRERRVPRADAPPVPGWSSSVDRYPWMSCSGGPSQCPENYELSNHEGGRFDLHVKGDPSLPGQPYMILASTSGPWPATPLPGGALLPLVPDELTET